MLTSIKMPRRDLTLSNKIALLEQIKKQPPKTTHRKLSEITGVPKSTIARVVKQQDKLREEWLLCEGQQGTSQKRKREGKAPGVEEALVEWFCVVSGQGVRVNGPMLKSKSEELAKKLGHQNFKATDGWLSRWKCRNNIKLKNTKVRNHEEFICIDINPRYYDDENGDCEDVGGEKIAAKRQKMSENEDKDCGENDKSKIEKVTNEDAKKCICELRRYFMQKGSEGSPLSALEVCADFVHSKSVKRT